MAIDGDLLRQLVEQGMPFSEIARRLGVSRQAAKGKAWRMGLGRGEEGRVEALKAWHQSNRVKVRLFVRPETVIAASVADVTWPVTITSIGLCELEPGRCHWPTGERTGHLQAFCGSETVRYHRYCAEHARAAFERPGEGAADPCASTSSLRGAARSVGH